MNPYKVLGVRPNASLDEIKTAYESLANTYDISNYQGSSEEPLAEDKISELNTAYNSLINEYKYKDIRDLIENQQFLSAETQLNLISDKSSAEWNYLEGFVLLKKGWFKAGVNHVKIAAELNPENEFAHNNLGILYLDGLMDAEEALEYFEEAIELNPSYTLAYFNAGRASQQMGFTNDAAR